VWDPAWAGVSDPRIAVSCETTSVLVAHDYDDPVAAEQRLRRSQRAVARKSARSTRTRQLSRPQRDADDVQPGPIAGHSATSPCAAVSRRSDLRRRFTAVRPASPFHSGSTCVAVSRRFDLRRRFTVVQPASRSAGTRGTRSPGRYRRRPAGSSAPSVLHRWCRRLLQGRSSP
jgi:hypothetical protein